MVAVRCLGSVNFVWITAAMSAGFDGVILLGCKYGDDYQCHFIKGSEIAASREKNIREKLEQMAMETERVELHQFQIDEFRKLPCVLCATKMVLQTRNEPCRTPAKVSGQQGRTDHFLDTVEKI